MNFIKMFKYYRERGYTWKNAATTAWRITR